MRLPALFVALLLTAPSLALAEGDPAAGRLHYQRICAVCHGESAEGREQRNAPRLAGQHGWYLRRQLMNFRDGVRGAHQGDEHGGMMAMMARQLPDEQAVADVVSYIATLDADEASR